AGQIVSGVRSGVTGNKVTTLKNDGDETDVVIRISGDYKERLSDFEQMEIVTPAGENIPLNQIADLSIVKGPIQINRESQERVVTVNSQIVGRDLSSVVTDIEKEMNKYDMPEG